MDKEKQKALATVAAVVIIGSQVLGTVTGNPGLTGDLVFN